MGFTEVVEAGCGEEGGLWGVGGLQTAGCVGRLRAWLRGAGLHNPVRFWPDPAPMRTRVAAHAHKHIPTYAHTRLTLNCILRCCCGPLPRCCGPRCRSSAHDHDHEAGADGGCRVCGTACAWDAESEWMERWGEWESRLAYYDKATGPLMDEW